MEKLNVILFPSEKESVDEIEIKEFDRKKSIS